MFKKRAEYAVSHEDRLKRRENEVMREEGKPRSKKKKDMNPGFSHFSNAPSAMCNDIMELADEDESLTETNLDDMNDEFMDSSIHTDVQLFPNNFALVRKTQTLPQSNEATELFIKEFPSTPVHGSFWIDLSEGNLLFDYKLENTKSIQKNTKTTSFSNISSVLENNIGKTFILVLVNLNYNMKNTSESMKYDLECKILSIQNGILVVEVNNEIRIIKSQQVVGFRGREISYSNTTTTSETINNLSIGITQAGPGGTFTVMYLVKAASYEVSQNVVINEKAHSFSLTNKLTIQCLTKGMESVDSLKIVGASGMDTDISEFLFTGNNPNKTYGNSEQVDVDKLKQFGICQTSLAKLYQEIEDIELPKGEKQAVILLDGVKGKQEDVFCLDSKDASSGKVPCFQKLKIFNSSDNCLIKGNVMVTDHEGLQVAQGCLDETNKSDHGFIMLSQSFIVDCKYSSSVDKNSRETNNETIYTHTVEFELKNRVECKVKVRLLHSLKGLIISNTTDPVQHQSQVLLGDSNPTNNLVWELELTSIQIKTIKVIQEVNVEKHRKKGSSSFGSNSIEILGEYQEE